MNEVYGIQYGQITCMDSVGKCTIGAIHVEKVELYCECHRSSFVYGPNYSKEAEVILC